MTWQANAAAATVSPPAHHSSNDGALIRLAETQFPGLTPAEEALLLHEDIGNTSRAAFAVAGTSPDPEDPSNDPGHANKWGAERNVRASLIRWLCVDPRALALVDPGGIRLFGARITGPLELSYVHVPFALVLNHCSIPERINLHSAETRQLNLNGSYTNEIDGEGIDIKGQLLLGYGFHASGEVVLTDARVGGSIDCGAGHFQYSKVEPQVWGAGLHKALTLEAAQVRSDIYLWDGFESDGMIYMNDAVLGADLYFMGARVSNPGGVAISAASVSVKGNVLIGPRSIGENSAAAVRFQRVSAGFETDALVDFSAARVDGSFVTTQSTFKAVGSAPSGFIAPTLAVRGSFTWSGVTMDRENQLNLSAASMLELIDDPSSWPAPGKLNIDGLTYQGIVPADAVTRLRWIGLQSGFHPQPYRQLAKVQRESGDEIGAQQVLVALEDARYARFGPFGRATGALLKWTIGYGYRPLLTVMWSLAVIALGWGLVSLGKRAHLLRPIWPENAPEPAAESYEDLNPLLYSIDAFFPFVDLHQEHYWWPDTRISNKYTILGRTLKLSGRMLRYYLWFEIGAGWLLSAIFLAGVSGLLRNN